MDDEIVELVREGRKVEAIKRYRERFGVDLADAKRAVDAIEAHGGRGGIPDAPIGPDAAFTARVETMLRGGQRIQAIKLYREQTGCGLKEAKEAVDRMGVASGIAVPSTRCFVATAAYGTAMAPEIDALRRLRDERLVRRAPGRAIVRAYERVAPPLAAAIASRPRARAAVRALLSPAVALARRL